MGCQLLELYVASSALSSASPLSSVALCCFVLTLGRLATCTCICGPPYLESLGG
jgi:hypothetical protein